MHRLFHRSSCPRGTFVWILGKTEACQGAHRRTHICRAIHFSALDSVQLTSLNRRLLKKSNQDTTRSSWTPCFERNSLPKVVDLYLFPTSPASCPSHRGSHLPQVAPTTSDCLSLTHRHRKNSKNYVWSSKKLRLVFGWSSSKTQNS